MAILEWFQTPLGPLPMWIWLVAGAVTIYLIKRFRGKGAVESVLTSDAAGPAVNDDNAGGGPLDNEAWGSSAIASLVNSGYDPLQADYAIRTYLDGGQLDPSMVAILNAALRGNGPPPELLGDPGGTVPTMPTPNQPGAVSTPAKTPTANPNYKTISYKVQKGDTFEELSKKFGVPVSKLRQDSGMTKGHLDDKVGQTLKFRVKK